MSASGPSGPLVFKIIAGYPFCENSTGPQGVKFKLITEIKVWSPVIRQCFGPPSLPPSLFQNNEAQRTNAQF